MNIRYDYLNDKNFLQKVDKFPIKEVYTKITILDFNNEYPVADISGTVTSGNISINGSSSVRRTASLTILLTEENNKITRINNLFSINKKVYIELGYNNFTNEYTEYPVLWFPQGIFLIQSASISYSSNGQITAQLQLKDKMSLLNGECGGTIPASTCFSSVDELTSTGEYITIKNSIYQIIQELVHHYGGENLSKILISDIPDKISAVQSWNPMREESSALVNLNAPLYRITTYSNNLKNEIKSYSFSLEKQENILDNQEQIQYNFGDDIGNIYTSFVWSDSQGDLSVEAGASVTSVLDNIIQVLGNYEYFYDVYGNFIFREIKNYLNTSQATSDYQKIKDYQDSGYYIDIAKGKAVYSFNDNFLFSSYTNSPNFSNIKNDYIIRGTRNINQTSIPICYHLAIDSKPKLGNIYKNLLLVKIDGNWDLRVIKNVNSRGELIDIIWEKNEEFYYQEGNNIKCWSSNLNSFVDLKDLDTPIEYKICKEYTAKDWRTELYIQGLEEENSTGITNYYYAELKAEWAKVINLETQEFKYNENNISSINYWLDFIGESTDAWQYNIQNIGRRTYAVNANNSGVNCVFAIDPPQITFIKQGEVLDINNNDYTIVELPDNIYNNIGIGGKNYSAFEYLRSSIYKNLSYGESISISSIPIYYLEPNTRINVYDTSSNIYGDYIINTISYNFGESATMSLSCNRALERI